MLAESVRYRQLAPGNGSSMFKFHSMRMVAARFSTICAACLVLASLPTFAAEPNPQPVTAPSDRFLQQEQKQQQIRNTTQRVGEQLGAIIAEFDRNGISGEDVKVLRAIRSVLGKLTEKDMEKVLQLLQQSRQARDTAASTHTATDAYAGQRMILTQLNQLVLEYQRQQALYELSLRFREFANRETSFMWQAVQLAKKTEGRQPASFSEEQQNTLRLLQIDQEPIKDEVGPVIGKLQELAKEIQDGPAADRPKAALQQAKEGGLFPALDSAVEDLKSGKILSATSSQKKARDQFREIARLLLLSQGEVEALRQAIREVDQTIEQQKAVAKDTAKIEKDDAKLEPRQAELVDATDSVRRDIETIAPVAVEELKGAMEHMQQARAILNSEKDPKRQREKAPPRQEQAVAGLQQAKRALQDQLAKAEGQTERPENALAGLKQLQEKLRDVIKKQEVLKDESASAEKNDLASKAPRQGDLRDQTQELQPQAAPASPQAAQSLAEAAGQMQKAQNSLANSQNNAPAQQAALDSLQKADQQLSQDISRLEEAKQELAALEELLKKLVAIIEGQQKVQSVTANEASKPQRGPLEEVAGQQSTLGKETGELQQEAEAPVPPAAEHLSEAKGHMADAKTELDKPAPKSAHPQQAEALVGLYAAKRDIEAKMEELKNMLGENSPDQAQSLADAASMIEQAQKDVSQAMSQMQQSDAAASMKQAGQSLEHANGLVSPLAAGKAGALPPSAEAALQSAQGSLANGSAQASSGQGAPAQASAASAAQALAQAQAALALAQAGLNSESAMAANGQGQGQGQQGKGQGQGQQGKGQGQGPPGSKGTGRQGNWDGPGGADGPRRNTAGAGQFTGLPKRDRAAIQQSQAEKYPQEYGPLVEQYLRNLSDQNGK